MSEPLAADRSLTNEDLAPTTPEQRTWTTYNYAALWIGMAHCIPTYTMASGLIGAGMNWKQALFTILLGNLIVLIPMLLNSYGGTKYGLPFPVLCRASFGVKGANLPAILRALVACGWFGIQTWIGGEALDQLLSKTWPAWDAVWHSDMVAFFIFWALNIWIIWRGMDAVRWFEGWAAPMVLVVAVILLIYMVQRAHGLGPILDQPGKMEDTAEFLKKLPIFLTAQIGFWATLSLNMPDFTRFAKNQKAQMLGQVLGLPTTMTFFAGIGVLITSATIVVYGEAIWDPIALLAKPEFGHPIVVLISLISIGVATLSVNVAANVVSPAFDLANIWPEKINFKIGGTITGIIGILMCPWYLYHEHGNYIFTWLVGYSALLGPIAGIMICDFWVLRNKHLSIPDLYRLEGRYTYTNGVNRWAIWALILGVLPNVPGFMLQACPTKVPIDQVIAALDSEWLKHLATASRGIYDFAWMIGFAVSFVFYWIFMTRFNTEQVEADRQASLSEADPMAA
ncbi:MAG: NCS1 family nucleobase:cation symporter-1 [Armatimonadetes bacterium]|nr:NCS1 family nucleobase:cation symporter-1 [Armatimonadota bacterium]